MSTHSSWLMPALDDLGLAYAVRDTPAGVPYAGFGMVGPGGRMRSLTALEQDGALRLTAHDLPALPLQGLMAVTRTTLLGRALLLPDSDTADFVVSCHVGAGVSAVQLRVLLNHLVAEVDVLDGTATAPPWPPVAPEADIQVADLTGPAARRGTPAVVGGTVQVDFVMDKAPCRLSLKPRPGGWVFVRGAWGRVPVVSDDEGAWQILQRLQNWTVAGRYVVLDRDQLFIEVSTPVVDGDVAGCTDWTLSQATLMLQVAQRHLQA